MKKILFISLATGIVLAAPSSAASITLIDDAFGPLEIIESIDCWAISGEPYTFGVSTSPEICPSPSAWAYIAVSPGLDASGGIHRTTGSNGIAGDTINVAFDFGSAPNSAYTGVFTVSLWDGSPVDGEEPLFSMSPITQAAGEYYNASFQHILAADTSGELFLQFYAKRPESGAFLQRIVIDNVKLTLDPVPEPSSALLGGLGLSTLLLRRRKK